MRYLPDPETVRRLTTEELRARFVLDGVFQAGAITLHPVDLDRALVGAAVPTATPLALEAPAILAASHFTERRELGILNVGSRGRVHAGGRSFDLETKDGLYIGRGTRDISFESDDAARPARFYIVSYPAHAEHAMAHVAHADVEPVRLGDAATANRRRLYKYFHPDGVRTAQLVMGFTELEEGSVWNTMPPHTHARRTEVYMYFGIPEDAFVVHLMGEPHATRNLIVRDGQVVLSPGWSIHAGCGTRSYGFCWAMGGENQDFADMQGVAMTDLH